MIVGIGADLVHVARIAGVYERRGDRFLRRVLSADEQTEFRRRVLISAIETETQTPKQHHSPAVLFLASRWALKEATYKACFPYRLVWSDIQADAMDGA